MIKYGISRNYLPNWGIQEALREVFQNFLDYGKYNLYTIDKENKIKVCISNDYNPAHLGFLAIGESGKRNNNSTIGKHGEGLKMALMVLTRLVCHPSIIINYEEELDYTKKEYESDCYIDGNLPYKEFYIFKNLNNGRKITLIPNQKQIGKLYNQNWIKCKECGVEYNLLQTDECYCKYEFIEEEIEYFKKQQDKDEEELPF